MTTKFSRSFSCSVEMRLNYNFFDKIARAKQDKFKGIILFIDNIYTTILE